jgi:uncharacterized membrane protein (UPF0136 family)
MKVVCYNLILLLAGIALLLLVCVNPDHMTSRQLVTWILTLLFDMGVVYVISNKLAKRKVLTDESAEM